MASPMHVLFVDDTLTTPPTGGAHTALARLAGALVSRGITVTVVTQPGPERWVADRLVSRGVRLLDRIWRPGDLPEERAGRLAQCIAEQRPDVYVLSVSRYAGWIALPLLEPEVATVTIAHNDVEAFYAPLRHYRDFVDCAVGVSDEIHRRIVADCGIPPERALRIAYGVETAAERGAPRSPGEPLRVGYLGRMVQEQKRIFDLIAVARALRDRAVSFELHLVGDGPDREALEAAVRREGLSGAVVFWGWQSPEAVRARLRELDLFLLVSDCEGLPVALLEAMAHGVVPIVSAIPSGNTQVVADGENGFAVPVGDVAAFADRIARLAADPDLLSVLGRAAWRSGQDYTIERMVDRYLEGFGLAAALPVPRLRRSLAASPFPLMPACRSAYPYAVRKAKRLLLAAAGRWE